MQAANDRYCRHDQPIETSTVENASDNKYKRPLGGVYYAKDFADSFPISRIHPSARSAECRRKRNNCSEHKQECYHANHEVACNSDPQTNER